MGVAIFTNLCKMLKNLTEVKTKGEEQCFGILQLYGVKIKISIEQAFKKKILFFYVLDN